MTTQGRTSGRRPTARYTTERQRLRLTPKPSKALRRVVQGDAGPVLSAHHAAQSTASFDRATLVAERLEADADRAVRWAAVWTVLLTISAWRQDQSELDALVASSKFEEILEA